MNDGPPSEPFMIALATLNLLTDVAAERPVLLVADDVQWLDQPAQDVLTFLARRLSSDPCVLIGAVRKGHDIAFATAGLPELDLRGLDETSARDVLARHAAGLSYADTERILGRRPATRWPWSSCRWPSAQLPTPGWRPSRRPSR
jgi:hypothetical protein